MSYITERIDEVLKEELNEAKVGDVTIDEVILSLEQAKEVQEDKLEALEYLHNAQDALDALIRKF